MVLQLLQSRLLPGLAEVNVQYPITSGKSSIRNETPIARIATAEAHDHADYWVSSPALQCTPLLV